MSNTILLSSALLGARLLEDGRLLTVLTTMCLALTTSPFSFVKKGKCGHGGLVRRAHDLAIDHRVKHGWHLVLEAGFDHKWAKFFADSQSAIGKLKTLVSMSLPAT